MLRGSLIQPIATHHTKAHHDGPLVTLEDARRASFVYLDTLYSVASCPSELFKSAVNYQGTDETLLSILAQKELDLYDRWYLLADGRVTLSLILPDGRKLERVADERKRCEAQQREQMKTLLDEGKTPQEIASIMHMPVSSVRAYVGRLHRSTSEEQAEKRAKMISMIEAGIYSNSEIARICNIHRSTVASYKRNG